MSLLYVERHLFPSVPSGNAEGAFIERDELQQTSSCWCRIWRRLAWNNQYIILEKLEMNKYCVKLKTIAMKTLDPEKMFCG